MPLPRFLTALFPVLRRRPWMSALTAFISGLIFYIVYPMPPSERGIEKTRSMQVVDRSGIVLREVLSSEFSRAYPVRLNEIPSHLISATLAAEDKNFYTHLGIDFTATLRAVWQNLTALRVVSGASTITQQTARLMLGEGRGLGAKLHSTLYALRLEWHLSKDDILERYFNLAPYGNQTNGAAAAAMQYFSKPPSELTVGEAALLAGLPQSPTGYDPLRQFDRAKERQSEVLRRMRANGWITDEALADALAQPVDVQAAKRNFLAPHFVDFVLKSLQDTRLNPLQDTRLKKQWETPSASPTENAGTNLTATSAATLTTTLDYPLQERCEKIVGQHLEKLASVHVTNAAVVIIENATGEILTMVGSANYFDAAIDGAFNGATAARQAGSSVKPFAYAVALERGMTAATVLADLPLQTQTDTLRAGGENYAATQSGSGSAGMFIPQNYDKKYHGPVRLRQALACSYNVPAVKLLESIGVQALLDRMRNDLRLTTLPRDAAHYGLGLALGNAEVRLTEMVRAYSTFARRGSYKELSWLKPDAPPSETSGLQVKSGRHQCFSPQAAHLVLDMLSDNRARRPAFGENSVLRFPFAAACKTGTTKDYRDNWAFCITERFTLGVWAGNFDGSPMQHVSGVAGAGPILHDAAMALMERFPDEPSFEKATFDLPAGFRIEKICPVFGEKAGAHCPSSIEEIFISGTAPHRACTVHRTVELDSRNNLLATAITPERYKLYRQFDCFPPMYRAWAAEQHKALPPVTASLLGESGEAAWADTASDSLKVSANFTGNSAEASAGLLQITYPKPNMVFTIDPNLRRDFQALALTAAIDHEALRRASPDAAPQWFIDGKPLDLEPAPSKNTRSNAAFWKLEVGAHRAELVAGTLRSNGVEFFVVE